MKKIIITGATGSIGSRLCKELIARGDEVTVFTRNTETTKQKFPDAINIVNWDYNKPNEWKEHLNGLDALLHLAGVNLGAKRWNKEYKKLAYESRVTSTRNLVEAVADVDKKPETFICSSAVGYYGNRGDDYLSESEGRADNFLAKLCADWENETKKVEPLGVRHVSVRTGLVLNKDEGLLKQMIPSFKLFLGGYLGNGKQWFPWIHIDDIVDIYLQAVDNDSLHGAINAASSGIVRMKEFSKTLGRILHRPSFLPIPKFAIRILKGELGKYVTDSQRVVMDKLLKSGYKFKFENLDEALRDLLKK